MSHAEEDNPYLEEPARSFAPVADLERERAREHVEQLRSAIRRFDHRYYVENDPIIADRTYDQLFERLQKLEAAFGLEDSESPTARVGGAPLDELTSVEHVAPMLSIESGGDAADVREFDSRMRRELGGRVAYHCEPKFDGLSIEILYRDGRYERAATRGDGHEGDDVTEAVRTISSVPLVLSGESPASLAVRGEVYMPRDAFQAHNRERVEAGEEPFANPRNAAAGTLRQLDPGVTAERPLDCFFFDVLDSSVTFDTHWDQHQRLPDWGLKVTERSVRVDDIEDALDYRDRIAAERDALNYELDGVVLKVNDLEACESLGATARAYRWAFAYKFPARSGTTTITDIVVQVGRTGRLTPVALLDPVDVGGVTVSRANLHNQAEIRSLGVGVGDTVRLERAGDVIPDVVEVLEAETEATFTLPEDCPECHSPVEVEGPLQFCSGGLACAAQLQRAVEHYASDTGLDIEGLGEEAAEEFVDCGLIEELADLYSLTALDLTAREGWGAQSAGNLLEEIEATREPLLSDFIAAIGVPEVGPTLARDFAREFDTFDAFRSADSGALQQVEGVGPTVASHVREFFSSEANQGAIDRLLEAVEPQPLGDTEQGSDALEGLTIVFTGSIPGFTRDDLEAAVERHGANATSSVSGNTDYLVAGEGAGASKRSDAAEHDVTVSDPAEFFDWLDSAGVELDTDS